MMEAGQPYSREFYAEDVNKYARPAAEVIVPLVLELIRPKHVVDVGCGTGTWLSVFRDHGVEDICGIDGHWIDRTALEIPEASFIVADLEKPLRLERRFDLVVSLEVAEHLAAASAAQFVHSLTGLGEVVLFSAALPGQGGTNHVNEQWAAHWARLFRSEGYVCLDPIRPRVWRDERVPPFYAQNILVFCTEQALASFPALAAADAEHPPLLDLVHPEFFRSRVENFERKLGRLQTRLEQTEQRRAETAEQLANVTGSRWWRLGGGWWRLRRRLALIARISQRARSEARPRGVRN